MIYKLPVRELSNLTIYDYVNAVECGDKIALSDEMRYFIPRIFELLVEDEEICMEFEDSLSKCYLNLGVWSELELTVFKQFAKLFLKNKLCQYNDEFHFVRTFGIIEMIYLSGMVEIIDELLEILLKGLKNDVALINFCAYIYYTSYDCDIDCHCDGCQGLYGKISQWINCPHHKHIISQKILALTEKSIYQTLDDDYKHYIGLAFDILSN